MWLGCARSGFAFLVGIFDRDAYCHRAARLPVGLARQATPLSPVRCAAKTFRVAISSSPLRAYALERNSGRLIIRVLLHEFAAERFGEHGSCEPVEVFMRVRDCFFDLGKAGESLGQALLNYGQLFARWNRYRDSGQIIQAEMRSPLAIHLLVQLNSTGGAGLEELDDQLLEIDVDRTQ